MSDGFCSVRPSTYIPLLSKAAWQPTGLIFSSELGQSGEISCLISALGSIDNAITVTGDDTESEQSVAPLYGVWFNVDDAASFDDQNRPLDSEEELIGPDLVRVAFKEPSFDDIGLLEQISQEDLLNTDLYVYRESTGELVIEKSPFAINQGNALNGVDVSTDTAFFELAIPGRDGRNAFCNQFRVQSSYEQWQASLGVTEAFQSDSDSLRVGEPIRVVAINRATGYLGSVRTSVSSTSGADLGIELEQLVLYPPNIKVRVERHYEVAQGLTQGGERHYKVGSEGAALTSDQYVSIHTEWLDQDGGQLPTTLPGYTARLSSLVASNTLDSNVTHFGISPGKHIEVLKLNAGTTGVGAAHQYFHMVAQPIDEPADFTIARDGPLQYRPEKYVPVRVAVYDEEASSLLKRAQDALYDQNTQQDSSVYQWAYRPEMAYSVFELDIQGIERELDGESTIDIQSSQQVVIGGSDTALNVEQYLNSSNFDSLSLFGAESDLVYSIEQYQQQAITGQSTYEFGELDFLGALEPEDFLSLNLLNNQDAGNVLWEWAFEYLSIDSILLDEDILAEDGTLVISADDLPVDIRAILIGSNQDADPRMINWQVIEGDGDVLEGPRQLDDGNGVWPATLEIDPVAGNEVIVQGRLGDDQDGATTMRPVYIIPGAAATIEVDLQGQAYMLGHGQTEITLTVRDQFGNTVADGTPVGLHTSGGLLEYEELSTVDGIARAVLVGGEDPAIGAQLTASVFDVTQTTPVEILPLELTLAGLGDTHFRNEQSTLIATVTAGGAAAAEVEVDFIATHALVDEYSSTTNEQGQINMPLVHLRPGELASATATIGVDISQTLEYTLRYRNTGERRIESVETMVLGDQSRDGEFQHERYDGVVIDYDYNTRSPFAIQGDANESITVTIGDLADPNIPPMAAWPMSELDSVADEAVTHSVDLVQSATHQIAAPVTGQSDENGFALDVTLAAFGEPVQETTTLLDMAGSYRLIREVDGLATLEVNTTGGTVALRSTEVLQGTHRIEAHLIDGLISFSVDDEREELQIREAVLSYNGETQYTVQAPKDHLMQVSALVFDEPAGAPSLEGFVTDATGLHIASTANVEVVNDSPMQVGKSFLMSNRRALQGQPGSGTITGAGSWISCGYQIARRHRCHRDTDPDRSGWGHATGLHTAGTAGANGAGRG